MQYHFKALHCGDRLLQSLGPLIHEINDTLSSQPWQPSYSFTDERGTVENQAAYNKSLSSLLQLRGWEIQPKISNNPRLIGDFAKLLVFGEIQFGNSATLYRDFYKFQYAHQNGLYSLSILIVPNDEYKFFPKRPASVKNMANFSLAMRYFSVLPISVPTIVYGLLADGEQPPV